MAQGVDFVRVHDVLANVRAIKMGIRNSRKAKTPARESDKVP